MPSLFPFPVPPFPMPSFCSRRLTYFVAATLRYCHLPSSRFIGIIPGYLFATLTQALWFCTAIKRLAAYTLKTSMLSYPLIPLSLRQNVSWMPWHLTFSHTPCPRFLFPVPLTAALLQLNGCSFLPFCISSVLRLTYRKRQLAKLMRLFTRLTLELTMLYDSAPIVCRLRSIV